MRLKKSSALDRAIAAVGTRTELARKINVSPSAITHWRGRVPLRQVLAVERATCIPRHELRPDYFDAPPAKRAADIKMRRKK